MTEKNNLIAGARCKLFMKIKNVRNGFCLHMVCLVQNVW